MNYEELARVVGTMQKEHASFVKAFACWDKEVLSPAFENTAWCDSTTMAMAEALDRMRRLIDETQVIADQMHDMMVQLARYQQEQFEQPVVLDFRKHKD